VREGVWNSNATSEFLTDQNAMNLVLAALGEDPRDTLARALNDEFVSGVHAALRVLHGAQIDPFDGAVEGTPFMISWGPVVRLAVAGLGVQN
jgi:hypothetical protein